MDTLPNWLQALGLERYASIFAENGVDLDSLPLLDEGELEKLAVLLGHRKKLLRAISDRNRSPAPPATVPAVRAGALAQAPVSIEAERRQLTVLFCDLVGSTELSRRLDLEDYRELVRSYRSVCAEEVSRFDGHIAQYLGDGLLIYFGYPKAHEDDAQRAVRAALAMVDAVARLDFPSGPLAMRVGIHTGVVVVGEVGAGATHEQLALGDTPNLAARLQSLAAPGGVLLSDRTRQITAGSFEYRDRGPHRLKGIEEPVHVWQPVSQRTANTRFEAERGGPLAPMVGRELEFTVLLHAWERAKSGRGQVVLLCGEPGIGKSRIWHALREKLGEEGVTPWQYQCLPDFANSAFYLAIEYFQRALKFEREPSPEIRLDKLQQMLQGYGRPQLDANLLGQLLALPAAARYGALGMTPQKQKDETIRALNDVIETATRRRPVLMLFEDLHWADPSSLESLEALRNRMEHLPLLLVATCRSEFRPQWIGQPGVTALTLGRLGAEQIRAIAARVAGGKELPGEILDQIVAKTDGIPLFVEELTKAILESGLLKAGDSGYELSGPLASLAIPNTLRDSLMTRLDRLAPVKEIAQIAACIGREFQPELLALISPRGAIQLQQALDQLVVSELVFTRGQPPNVRYVFKHALIQEAAYDSLLKARRIQVHAQIAEALERHFPEIKETEPELLAHHYSAAGLTDESIAYWRRAGELALQRVALNEAIAHLTKGLEVVATLPASAERDANELALRTWLGTAWMVLRGWPAPEVEANFSPALRLAKSLDYRPSYLPVLHGLHAYDLVRGRIAEASKWIREMQDTAEALDDPELRISGHRLAVTSNFWMGHFQEVRRHGDRIAALYDANQGRHIETLTNHDPLTVRGVWGAASLWMLGYPEQAVRLREETEAHARARAHPFGLCMLLIQGSWAFNLRGEPDQVLLYVDEAEQLGRAHRMPVFSEVLVPLWRALTRVDSVRGTDGISQLQHALGKWNALGGHLGVPYVKAVLAAGIARSGDIERSLELIEECFAQIERPGWEERACLSEVLRLKGWMLELQGKLDEAQQTLRAALDVARQQEAKSWELRAATTLARLLMVRGAHAEARDLLAPIYAWFTEGFDTHDLKQAKALLEELS